MKFLLIRTYSSIRRGNMKFAKEVVFREWVVMGRLNGGGFFEGKAFPWPELPGGRSPATPSNGGQLCPP